MNGLIYTPSFITQEESDFLVSQIDSSSWLTDLKRRTQHYGYKYDYTKKRIDSSLFLGPLPEWLNEITHKVEMAGLFDRTPDQVIVNEYQPGQGIASHIDCISCFGPVITSLSLLSSVKMDFSCYNLEYEDKSLFLEPRSLLILAGKARSHYAHKIDRIHYDFINGVMIPRQRRISLTFRTVIKE